MSSRPRKWTFRLRHIIEAADRIRQYVAGMSYAQFADDQRTIDAVLPNFMIIGEAARHMPEPVKARYPSVPWAEMLAMRNLVAHDYHGINLTVVWSTIQDDLPPLVPLLQAVLEAEGPNEG